MFKISSHKIHKTTIFLKNCIFWNATLHSPPEVHWRFGEPYCFHLQDQNINQVTNSLHDVTSQKLPMWKRETQYRLWNLVRPSVKTQIARSLCLLTLGDGGSIFLRNTSKLLTTRLRHISEDSTFNIFILKRTQKFTIVVLYYTKTLRSFQRLVKKEAEPDRAGVRPCIIHNYTTGSQTYTDNMANRLQ